MLAIRCYDQSTVRRRDDERSKAARQLEQDEQSQLRYFRLGLDPPLSYIAIVAAIAVVAA